MSTIYTLHYYFDPFCGWCYGAAPLLSQTERRVSELAKTGIQLNIRLHPGGMFSQPNCLPISASFRAMTTHHDARIAQLTGQLFGQAYQQELLFDTSRMLDSGPPSAAVLAAESLAGKGLAMLHSLQRSHYIDGLDITAANILLQQAEHLLPDPQAFMQCLADTEQQLASQFADTRQQMQRFGLPGFPALVLETADTAGRHTDSNHSLKVISHQPFYGQPAAFADHLHSQLNLHGA